jgi:uncharacterized protein with FMN-binding domain
MPKAVKIILIILGAVILLSVILTPIAMIGMDEVKEFEIPNIDLSRIDDGEYEGVCTISRWAMKVKVRVQDHKIRNIEIVDKMMSNLTQDMIAEIHKQIIDRETPRFDVVTGASITNKAYLIAITDALHKSMK